MIPLIILLLNLNVVPVLAEPENRDGVFRVGSEVGKARDGTQQKADVGDATTAAETRGNVQHSWFVHSELSDYLLENKTPTTQGANTSQRQAMSQAEMWVRLQEEGQPWTEPPILKGNSTADRLKHDPE